MRRFNVIKSIIMLLLIIMLIGLTACSGGQTDSQPQTATASRGSLFTAVESNGSIAISRDAQLSFATGGRIASISVKEDDKVTQGTVLAKLDTSALELAVSQAQVAVTQAQLSQQTTEYELKLSNEKRPSLDLTLLNAEIGVKTAQYNLDTAKDVYRWPEVEEAQADLDKAESFLQYAIDQQAAAPAAQAEMWARTLANAQVNYAAAETKLNAQLQGYDTEEVAIKKLQLDAAQKTQDEAQKNIAKINEEIAVKESQVNYAKDAVALAQLTLAQAQKTLKDATLAAPFDGTIVTVNVEEGATVTPATPCFYLLDINQMELTVDMDEIDVPSVKVGQEAIINLDALPGKEFKGQVSVIQPVPTVVGGVVMYRAKIKLDVPENSGILIGMSASADIITSKKDNILLAPSRAITEDEQGKSWVNVMVGTLVEKKEVVTGITDGTNTEIVSGLAEGETIVIESRTRQNTQSGIFG